MIVVFWSPLDMLDSGSGHARFRNDRSCEVRRAQDWWVFESPASLACDGAARPPVRQAASSSLATRMAATGYFGGHFGPDSPLFLRKYVVPLLQITETAGR